MATDVYGFPPTDAVRTAVNTIRRRAWGDPPVGDAGPVRRLPTVVVLYGPAGLGHCSTGADAAAAGRPA
jgi:O-acetyl-ADP-ribose deacetylase (regulator of RNase III)